MALSAAAVGLGTVLADGWDEIGVMLLAGALLFPGWCAGSVMGLRWAARRWLHISAKVTLLAGVAAASATAGTGVAWLAASGALPAGAWGPVLLGPAAAIAVLAWLLVMLVRREAGRASA